MLFCNTDWETFFHWANECPAFWLSRREIFLDKTPDVGMEWKVDKVIDFSHIPVIDRLLSNNMNIFSDVSGSITSDEWDASIFSYVSLRCDVELSSRSGLWPPLSQKLSDTGGEEFWCILWTGHLGASPLFSDFRYEDEDWTRRYCLWMNALCVFRAVCSCP